MKRAYSVLVVCTSILMGGCSSIFKPISEDVQSSTIKQEPAWSYEGETAPHQWANIDKNFAMCAEGAEQSPINIEYTRNIKEQVSQSIQISYSTAKFSVENTGHTIQASNLTSSNYMVIDGEVYKLIQMHFHHPSEHLLNGQSFEMEGHLVHQNAEGKYAVLGFFIQTGEENRVLDEMWSKLPTDTSVRKIVLDDVNLSQLLSKEKEFFQYRGSLTTPPCTEGVQWFVLEHPIEMAQQQIELFSSIFQQNSRPIQKLNNRKVFKIDE